MRTPAPRPKAIWHRVPNENFAILISHTVAVMTSFLTSFTVPVYITSFQFQTFLTKWRDFVF